MGHTQLSLVERLSLHTSPGCYREVYLLIQSYTSSTILMSHSTEFEVYEVLVNQKIMLSIT